MLSMRLRRQRSTSITITIMTMITMIMTMTDTITITMITTNMSIITITTIITAMMPMRCSMSSVRKPHISLQRKSFSTRWRACRMKKPADRFSVPRESWKEKTDSGWNLTMFRVSRRSETEIRKQPAWSA